MAKVEQRGAPANLRRWQSAPLNQATGEAKAAVGADRFDLRSRASVGASKIKELRGTSPVTKETAAGRKILAEQAGMAEDLLAPVSRSLVNYSDVQRVNVNEGQYSGKMGMAEGSGHGGGLVNAGGGFGQSGGLIENGGAGSDRLVIKAPKDLPDVDWGSLKVGDQVPAKEEGGGVWTVVEHGNGIRLERAGPEAKDGKADWTQTLTEGVGSTRLEREVPAADGGPNWVESRISENITGPTTRTKPDPDGGPDWNETKLGNGQVMGYRQTPDPKGGPPWNESRDSEGRVSKTRTEPDPDGGAPWHVRVDSEGNESRSRTYTDAQGRTWNEAINGENRWRINPNARKEAMEAGPHNTLKMEGPGGKELEIDVYGATPEELDRVRRKLEALPPNMRQHTGAIVISEELGQMLDAQGNVTGGIAGLGGQDGITLERSSVTSDDDMNRVLYHEMGHVKDFNSRNPSTGEAWGDQDAASCYGLTNRMEDYAEAHRIALTHVDSFQGVSRDTILKAYPQGERIVEILDSYDFKYGSGTTAPSIEMGCKGPPALPLILPGAGQGSEPVQGGGGSGGGIMGMSPEFWEKVFGSQQPDPVAVGPH